ncbi:hypothetical protein GGI24_003908 [Coemansia furcata]|nr:hypothetical protein GGI24_003908 [Coemansia furcata]
MVCFNIRSFALMTLAMVAAASPVINPVREAVAPVALSVPAAPAPLAPVVPLADASHKQAVAMADIHGPQQIQPVASSNAAKPENVDMSKMGVWVPCSESECMKDMTPEQQEAFKRDCEKMQQSHKKEVVNGKSRASDDTALNYFQMIIPEKDAARLALNNQRVTTIPSLHVIDKKAVGNRPAGKNLCCCCCCPCCCHCCCCPCCCCCKCCCCKCCCCCCPCCCHCCCC